MMGRAEAVILVSKILVLAMLLVQLFFFLLGYLGRQFDESKESHYPIDRFRVPINLKVAHG